MEILKTKDVFDDLPAIETPRLLLRKLAAGCRLPFFDTRVLNS